MTPEEVLAGLTEVRDGGYSWTYGERAIAAAVDLLQSVLQPPTTPERKMLASEQAAFRAGVVATVNRYGIYRDGVRRIGALERLISEIISTIERADLGSHTVDNAETIWGAGADL